MFPLGQDTADAVATLSSYGCLHWSHQHPGTDGEGTQGSLPYTAGLFATERVRKGEPLPSVVYPLITSLVLDE